MAIDPRIALQVKGLDVGQAVNQGINSFRQIQAAQQSKAASERVEAEAPFRSRILDAQAGIAEQKSLSGRDLARFDSVANLAIESQPALARAAQSGDITEMENILTTRIANLNARQLKGEAVDSEDAQIALDTLRGPGGVQSLLNKSNDIIGAARQRGRLKPVGGVQSAEQRSFERNISGLSEADQLKARRVKLRLDPGAVGSSALTISGDEDLTKQVADSQAVIKELGSEAVEIGKGKGIAKSAPLIAKARSLITREVKLAEKAAIERGDVLTDLSRAEAALPGLTDVVDKLRDLAPVATSTFGGRVYDSAVKELGFGSTKGATASAKFGAMVNNQVLPLLKPTFGAAFTVPEGDALRATMGDVNASVEEKMATLDAFMEQKLRDIETKKAQLNAGNARQAPASGRTDGTLMTDANGNKALVFPDGTFEEQ
jgi:hypothetical protein